MRLKKLLLTLKILYFQRETQADYREAAHYRNLEIQPRRRPSILGSDYHAAHAAAQHQTAIDRDRYRSFAPDRHIFIGIFSKKIFASNHIFSIFIL